MPIFEFKCAKCGHKFETIAASDEDGSSLFCLACGTPKPEKLPSVFSSSGTGSNPSGLSGCGSSHKGFS